MDLRFDNGPWQIVQGHDLILMRPEVYEVSSCGTQNLQEFSKLLRIFLELKLKIVVVSQSYLSFKTLRLFCCDSCNLMKQ